MLTGLTLAACGGGGESAGAGSSGVTGGGGDRARLERAALRHAECMRKEGIDVPDPKPGEGGIILSGPPTGGDPGVQERAVKKCGKYLRDVPPPKLSDEQKTAMRDGALKHARCMRGQGIEFPDPTFDDTGGSRRGSAMASIQATRACARQRRSVRGCSPDQLESLCVRQPTDLPPAAKSRHSCGASPRACHSGRPRLVPTPRPARSKGRSSPDCPSLVSVT